MDDGWSALAAEWSELWAASAAPAHEVLIAASAIGPASRVLDVGCGSGEFLRALAQHGAIVAGVDPAPGLVELARRVEPRADVREGAAQSLPWTAGSFDVVTAVNALQFADDTLEALTEIARVLVPGGLVAVANWAEGALNDLDAIEVPAGMWAVFRADGAYPDALQQVWAATATDWFPSNPWRLQPGPSIVAVLDRAPDFSTATCELWLPIEREASPLV